MVGDGGYLMMAKELVTAVQERVKVVVVLVQNHGFASIGSLSESLGVAAVRHALPLPRRGGRLDGDVAAGRPGRERRSLGADVIEVRTLAELATALAGRAAAATRTTVIHVETDPVVDTPASEAWWDVPVSRGLGAHHHPGGTSRVREAKHGQHHYL